MKRISMTSLRRKYPHPVRAKHSKNSDYCVAGALCREIGINMNGFPSQLRLCHAILIANPRIGDWYTLTEKQRVEIYNLAGDVIGANDKGNFNLSWKLLAKLLQRSRPKSS